MPSPFPGMDPYLERRDLFPDLHSSLITYLKEALQLHLPDPYYASSAQRAWIDAAERHVEPDVNIEVLRESERHNRDFGSATAIADLTEPVVVTIEEEEWVENYLEIAMGQGEERRLVTSIEILSPSNKTRHNKGRKLYRRKQRDVLRRAHLVEVDLLRFGVHTTAVPEARLRQKAGYFDYHVCTHQRDVPEQFQIHPIRMQQALPKVAFPLLPKDGHIEIDLQSVFHRAYDAGPYRKLIDYRTAVPDPPLNDGQAIWARERINAALAAR